MPRKKQPSEAPAVQVVFRVPQDLHDALTTAAAGLSVDLSNLLRMMIAEHVAEYIERGRRAAAALGQARAQARLGPTAEEQTRPTVQLESGQVGQAGRVARGGRGRRTIEIDPM
jgi:hypothetical protein